MANYTITLTDAEDKALGVIAVNKQVWIENTVKNRCRISKEEIVESEIKRIRASGGTVSGTDDEIVMAATVETAAERNARLESDFT
tara:strand:+ start:960 stop:1217 length:258 start_codon:yes stop_codon:yes gene_type:complete